MSSENTDLASKYFEERQMVAVPKSLFKWMSSMREDTFDQVADALVHFSNEVEEDYERKIVFSVVDDEPKYFRFFASEGEISFDDKEEADKIITVELLEQIDIDEFLDEISEGNLIIKDQTIKRFIASYEFI
jgi:SepF-like predicted cell division protein (DUF552 family)